MRTHICTWLWCADFVAMCQFLFGWICIPRHCIMKETILKRYKHAHVRHVVHLAGFVAILSFFSSAVVGLQAGHIVHFVSVGLQVIQNWFEIKSTQHVKTLAQHVPQRSCASSALCQGTCVEGLNSNPSNPFNASFNVSNPRSLRGAFLGDFNSSSISGFEFRELAELRSKMASKRTKAIVPLRSLPANPQQVLNSQLFQKLRESWIILDLWKKSKWNAFHMGYVPKETWMWTVIQITSWSCKDLIAARERRQVRITDCVFDSSLSAWLVGRGAQLVTAESDKSLWVESAHENHLWSPKWWHFARKSLSFKLTILTICQLPGIMNMILAAQHSPCEEIDGFGDHLDRLCVCSPFVGLQCATLMQVKRSGRG